MTPTRTLEGWRAASVVIRSIYAAADVPSIKVPAAANIPPTP
jgi:hypothetical protein